MMYSAIVFNLSCHEPDIVLFFLDFFGKMMSPYLCFFALVKKKGKAINVAFR